MKFVIPLPPQRANARGHWRVQHRAKLAYWSTLDGIQLLRQHDGYSIPDPPPEPLQKASASATVYLWNLMDSFNCGARFKWIEDWLVTRGYLLDDRMKNLHWSALPEQIIDRSKPRRDRVELTIEAIAT